MGSKKKNKSKSSSKTAQSIKKPEALFPEYITWIITGAVIAVTLAVGLLAKYHALFCVLLAMINGFLGWLTANYLRSRDNFPGGRDIFDNRRTWVATSGTLTALAVLMMYISIGVYPFGELTVVSGDMASEYIPFAVLRNQAVLSGDSLTYSDSLGLGGNLWSVLVYNVSSPLMLFSLFIDAENMDTFMFMLQIIKVGAAGSAFAYFYTEKFDRRDASAAVFSAAYALMSYSVGNMLNIIWMDCIIMLPLIILGVERIIQNKSAALYVICLAWAMITYYYIAYMICIYLVIYYIAYTAIDTQKFVLTEQVKSFARFAGFSLLSAGISAAVLIPSAFAISSAATHVYEGALDNLLSYNPLKLISQFLWNSEMSYLNEAMPNVYCSVLVPILSVFFLTCGKIPLRKKIALSVTAAIVILSTMISYVNYAWHGFHITSGLPYRFSFLISFTLLLMACEAAQCMEGISFNQIIAVTCGFGLVIFAMYFLDSDSGITMLIVSAVMLMLYIAMIAAEYMGAVGRNAAMAVMLLLVFGEMTFSGADIVRQINDFSGYTPKSYYNDIFNVNEKLIDGIKISDSDIYRIDDENVSLLNQSVYMNYSSLSYYATPNNGGLLNLMDSLGYANDTINKYNFNVYTPFSDSVLNLKYILSAGSGERNYLRLTEMSSKGKNVYENTLVLPRAFAVSGALLDWDVSDPNPFAVQNSMAKLAAGAENYVYDIITEQSSDKSADGRFVIRGNSYTAEYVFPRDGEVFCFVDCMQSDTILIESSGVKQTIDGELSCVIPLGTGKKGEPLRITFYGKPGTSGFVSAAMLNDAELTRSIEIMSQSPMSFSEYNSGKISGTVDVKNDCLLFTSIPYDKGWRVTVNGQKAETAAIGGGLLGVKLTAGSNKVDMKYSVRGLSAGVSVSLISLAAFIVYLFCRKRVAIRSCIFKWTQHR